jgi:hypothetical protein
MLQAIAVGVLILYAAIAWVMLRDYRRTRNIGFLIIGCGVLVWPMVSNLLMQALIYWWPGNLWARLLLAQTGDVIQAGLILIGVIAIQRSIFLAANR